MDRQIPIYFDSVIIDSPFQEISDTNPNIGRLKVRVFTKYGNRNGSYITEAVANQLIESATHGMTPVVGFFDPETKSWASHTGPTLANAYGYVESFLGWEPFTDTDNVTRDYAVFSVILFTEYYEEAQKIIGQNQSMELNPASIDGQWTEIEGNEYFVYSSAKMLGFCVIGEHEPCFSVSSFFSKNDDSYISQYEKFSSLLSDLKTQVEEAEKFNKGGEQPMENEVQQVVENEVQENEQQESENNNIEFESTISENEDNVEETQLEEVVVNSESVQEEQEPQVSEIDELRAKYEALNTEHEELVNKFQQTETTLNEEINSLRKINEELQTSLQSYEAQMKEVELQKKNSLIEKYEKLLDEEEIANVREKMADLTYDTLESNLAIAFANRAIANEETKKVMLQEQPKSQFAVLMEKYRIK